MDGYYALVVRLKAGTFTMTPKQWIVQTGAIGITLNLVKIAALMPIHSWPVSL